MIDDGVCVVHCVPRVHGKIEAAQFPMPLSRKENIVGPAEER